MFVRDLLQHRAKKYELSVDTKCKLDALQNIAYFLFENDSRVINDEIIVRKLESLALTNASENKMKSIDILLNEIVETSGILKCNRIGYYGFYHPLFQEFFVARKFKYDIAKGEINEDDLYKKYAWEDDERYSNVLAFLPELIELDKRESI